MLSIEYTTAGLSWLGHLARMPPGRLPRIALFAVMEDGERGRGQPPTTARRRMHGLLTRLPQDLADAKEPELQARLDTEGWISLTDDREAWRNVVNAAAGATTPTDRELSPTVVPRFRIPFRRKQRKKQFISDCRARTTTLNLGSWRDYNRDVTASVILHMHQANIAGTDAAMDAG